MECWPRGCWEEDQGSYQHKPRPTAGALRTRSPSLKPVCGHQEANNYQQYSKGGPGRLDPSAGTRGSSGPHPALCPHSLSPVNLDTEMTQSKPVVTSLTQQHCQPSVLPVPTLWQTLWALAHPGRAEKRQAPWPSCLSSAICTQRHPLFPATEIQQPLTLGPPTGPPLELVTGDRQPQAAQATPGGERFPRS